MTSEKPWERPWSLEEIINNADKWSLAGDVALLNSLKVFANNLVTKSTEINDGLQNLTNSLDQTSLRLNIAQNEFQSLRNSQFIESRVYEDDETLPHREVDDKAKKEEVDVDRTEDLKCAALKGLEVLEKYYDKVEVSISDSEDEDIDLPTYVFRPKDLYIDRPLPYLIGSDEWYQHFHVGLEDSSGESESEKVSDKFSESNSESDLPIIQDRSQIKETSDTSSEFEFSHKGEIYKPKSDFFTSSDSDEQNYVPAQNPILDKNFAEQLANKLGNIVSQEQASEPEVNTRPIQQPPHYGDIFFDEPPPLTEDKGLFSGGSGLFDDDDDDDDDTKLSTPKPRMPSDNLGNPSKQGLFDDELGVSDDDIFSSKKGSFQSNKKTCLLTDEPPALDTKKKPIGGVAVLGGFHPILKRMPSSDLEEQAHLGESQDLVSNKKVDLFDDDDNLFKSPLKTTKAANIVQPGKVNLFDSDDDEQNSTFSDRKSQSFENSINKKDSRENFSTLFDEPPPILKEEEKKTITLFNDDDDLFKEDLFSVNTKRSFTSGLFDDLDIQSDDLFSQTVEHKSVNELERNIFEDSLVTSDDKISINDNNFDSKNVAPTTMNDHSISIFPETPDESNSFSAEKNVLETNLKIPPSTAPVSLFDSPSPTESDELFSEPSFGTKEANTSKVNLERDDLFDIKNDQYFSFSNSENLNLFDQPEVDKSSAHTNISQAAKEEISSIGISHDVKLFDASPPPVDDWDTKSDASDDNFGAFDESEETTSSPATTLFSDEPPALDVKPKPIFQKVQSLAEKFKEAAEQEPAPKSNPTSPGKLKFNLDINVGALMPGAARLKRESSQKVDNNSEDVTDRSESNLISSGNEEKLLSKDSSTDKITINLDASDDKIEVLQSVTKDRVKVPFNRRPSTRRGRKAALKNSSSDFKLHNEEKEDLINEIVDSKYKSLFAAALEDNLIVDQKVAKIDVSHSTKKDPDTFHEDIVNKKYEENTQVGDTDLEYHLSKNFIVSSVPEATDDDLFSDNISSNQKPKEAQDVGIDRDSALFEDVITSPPKKTDFIKDNSKQSSSIHNPDIVKNTFTTPTTTHESFKQKAKKPTAGLFDDEEDDDDDIFKNTKITTKSASQMKTSLFDDDDDDDIFKSVSRTTAKKTEHRPGKRASKTSSIKKLENTKSEDDPLSALLNEE